MNRETIETVKQSLSAEIPIAIDRALQSYRDFASRPFPLDAKEYDAHHKACKAALAHLDALTKLLKFVEENDISDDESDGFVAPMQSMLAAARAGLLRIEEG